jgi:hypothetical protein
VASALIGFPAALNRGVIYDFPSNRITQTFYYVQDDFKLTPKLTLNIGLRYELYIPPVDRWDNQSNFDLGTGQMNLAGRGSNSRALVNADKNNFAPRIGFAYALQPRTAIRGGYGISYYPDKFGASGGTLNNNYPFISLQQIIPADRFKPDASLSIDKGIPVPVQPVLTAPSVPLVGSATYFDPNYKMGYIQFWNFTIQHQFTKNMSLETAYVGTRGVHLFGNNHVNINQPDPGPGAVQNRRPYYGIAPLATSVPLRDSSEWSIYHALQMKLQKRTANGLWLLATYTWSKAIDDNATSFNTRVWDAVTRGPANTDFRHNFTASAVYELPIGKGRKFGSGMNSVLDAIVGGWQINGINTFRTGLPSTATLSTGLANSTVNTGGSSRPDQVANPEMSSDSRTIYQYFNTAAFVAPANNSFRFGNAGRNTVRGPSYEGFDFSLFKNFKIHEQVKLQFRGEFFNVFNHPNYGQPGTQLGAATFGTITSLAGNATMRQSQMGLKLLW